MTCVISPTESQYPHKPAGKRPAGVGAATLIRRPKLWLIPAVLASLVALLLSLLYMGGILDPNGDLHHLPIALVDADSGAPLPGQQQNLGTQVAAAVVAGSPSGRFDWKQVGPGEAQGLLASGKVYGALEIPADFTASVGALLGGQATTRPTISVLTNPGLGSLGSSIASASSAPSSRCGSWPVASAPSCSSGRRVKPVCRAPG